MSDKTISIIVPCRNEEKHIAQCLNSLIDCDYDKNLMNIYVVDGMSDDNTREIISKYEKKYPFIKLIDNVKQTTPYAFNIGIRNSSDDYIMIMGARHIVSKNYISYSIDKLKNNNDIACIGGIVINSFENKLSEIIASAMNSSFGVGLGNFRTNNDSEMFVDTVGTPVYNREIFSQLGLFDENLTRNQDDEFNFRVIKAGKKILSSNKINVKYFVRASYKKLFKQYYQYGYWKVFVNRKHKTVTTLRQLVPGVFVLYLGFLLLSIIVLPQFICIASIPLLLYLLLSVYFSYRLSDGFRDIIYYMITFFILHSGYGLGYLDGIFDFIVLKKVKGDSKKETLSR